MNHRHDDKPQRPVPRDATDWLMERNDRRAAIEAARSRDETPTERPPKPDDEQQRRDAAVDRTQRAMASATPRSMNGGRRALDYRKGTQRMQRCSRCHSELELAKPVLYDLSNQALSEPEAHAPIMVGDILLGFCCKGCTHSLVQHVCSVFPEANGFPIVDHHGQLMSTPRCDECGAALAYAADGRSVLCPQCDTDAVTP